MRSSPPQLSFSAGELSPLLYGRPDYQRYQTGLAKCTGFIPLRQGGATRAPGTWYRGTTDADNQGVLIDFEFASNDTLSLEFTDLKMRIWRYGALVMDGGSPFELVTPYTLTDLANLQWKQSADVIYLADGRNPIQRLARLALDNWTIGDFVLDSGPFRVQNLDQGITIQASVVGTTATLTGVGDPFAADMVGTLIRLLPTDNTAVPLWVGNQSVSVGNRRRQDGKVYEVVSGSDTGVNPPIHLEGDENYNSSGNLVWRFISDGVGIVRITAVTDANTATANVIKTIPQACIDDPTYRWSEGAWSERYGYPSAIEIYEQRFVGAGTPSEPRTVWFSAIGGFDVFEPSTDADGSFAYAIAGGASQNRILWLKGGRRGLHIGALGEEYSTRSTNDGSAIGPTTTVIGLDSSNGSRAVRPIAPDGKPIFVSKDGTRMLEIAYSFEADANSTLELSLPSEHIGQRGFEEIAWQSTPLRLSWVRLADGDLAVLVYDPREDVLGWATCPLAGGKVESLSVTTGIDGTSDILTMIVQRTINGTTKRFVEEQAVNYGIVAGDQPIADANHLFAAVKFTPASPETVFSVPHLIGETVHAWTDKGQVFDLVVDGSGDVTLDVAVNSAIIGLLDTSHKIRTLDIQAPARDGSAIGRLKRLNANSGIVLHNTAGGFVKSISKDSGQPEIGLGPIEMLPRAVATDQTEAFSGPIQVPLTSDTAREIAMEFLPDGAAPLTILAYVPNIQEAGV